MDNVGKYCRCCVPCVFQSYYYYYGNGDPLIHLSIVAFVLTMFGVGLAIGVVIAVGMLFYVQVRQHENQGFSVWHATVFVQIYKSLGSGYDTY